jgi:hypothetical protein
VETDVAMVVHREIEGEHVDSTTCWCEPLVLSADDLHRYTVDQICDMTASRNRRN